MKENWQFFDRNANGIVDTYAHIPQMIPNNYNYYSLCAEAFMALRQANNYRPKFYSLPDPTIWGPNNISQNGMPPFSDYYTQARMIPGTMILGFTLGLQASAGAFSRQNNFYVEITDDGSGLPFFVGWVSETQFMVPVLYNDTTGITARAIPTQKFPWMPLVKPRPVADPGIVSIGFCAKYTGFSVSPNIQPQLTVICAEPCNLPRNLKECE